MKIPATCCAGVFMLTLNAHAIVPVSFPRWNDISHVVVDDSVSLSAAAAERVAKRLGMTRQQARNVYGTVPRAYYVGDFSMWGGFMPSAAFFLSRPPVDDSTFPVWESRDGRSRYGFYSDAGRPDLTEYLKGKNDNMDRILLSVYRQELDSVYADTLTDYRVYPPLRSREFESRLWLSTGYAMQYAYTDNLLTGSGSTLIAGSYLMDVATVAIMVGGAFTGNTTRDKVGFVVSGAMLNVFWKLSTGALGRGPVRAYNKVTQSGYKIPPLESRRPSQP